MYERVITEELRVTSGHSVLGNTCGILVVILSVWTDGDTYLLEIRLLGMLGCTHN